MSIRTSISPLTTQARLQLGLTPGLSATRPLTTQASRNTGSSATRADPWIFTFLPLRTASTDFATMCSWWGHAHGWSWSPKVSGSLTHNVLGEQELVPAKPKQKKGTCMQPIQQFSKYTCVQPVQQFSKYTCMSLFSNFLSTHAWAYSAIFQVHMHEPIQQFSKYTCMQPIQQFSKYTCMSLFSNFLSTHACSLFSNFPSTHAWTCSAVFQVTSHAWACCECALMCCAHRRYHWFIFLLLSCGGAL